jgi:TRAP-type C4-dicarboxylate transport system permease small subunit
VGDPLRRPVELALAASVAAASAAIFAQVVYRYLLNDPVAWLDEFAVLAFAWMTFLGAALVQRTDTHMTIDTFAVLLPARVQAVVYGLRVLAMAFVLGILAWQGWILTRRMSFIEYPAMEISRGWLFATLPVGAPLILYYLARTARSDLRRIATGKRVFDKPADASGEVGLL